MTRHFANKAKPEDGFYEVFTNDQGSRWQWTEPGHIDLGPWRPTIAAAYRAAADDWESNGNSANRRLSGQLRAAATRAEKKA